MKQKKKKKLSICKSLKLNEDFFDDFDSNDLINEPVDELIDEPDYTYHIQFIIFMYPFVKPDFSDDCEYVFDDPKYEHKLTIEHGFLSIKKALEYILQATPIVSDYSKPKFYSSSEKIINIFPFMTNKKSNEFIMDNVDIDDYIITLETSINLSSRKNINNLIKFFYSFWRLQKIYDKFVIRNFYASINMGIYTKNPYKKSILYELEPADDDMKLLELINFLNNKR